MQFVLKRDVTPEECDWLQETVKKDAIVHKCTQHTYGCVSWGGMAVTYNQDGDYPFFELPVNALQQMPIR